MDPKDVTALLKQWSAGNSTAGDELLPLVYAELRRLARSYMSRERPDHTLQATALVHEAYLRLVDKKDLTWQNRAQFYGLAAREMRRVLVEHARERGAQKRGGKTPKVPLDAALDLPAPERDADLLLLDRALGELEQLEPQQARIVELRYFGGLTVEEAAEVLGVSVPTVERKWRMGKAFLFRALGTAGPAL